MHYEINVSLNGWHFFATAPRSCETRKEMIRVYDELAKHFTAERGFEISVTRWEESGCTLDEEEIKEIRNDI